MSTITDAMKYMELLAEQDAGVAAGAPRGVPVADFEATCAERYGHSSSQVRRRVGPMRDAGIVLRLPAAGGRPARLRLTQVGIAARERVRSRSQH